MTAKTMTAGFGAIGNNQGLNIIAETNGWGIT